MMSTQRAPDATPLSALAIDSVSMTVVSRPYVRPFGISSGSSDVLTSLIVEVSAGDRVGFGEASPPELGVASLAAPTGAGLGHRLTPGLKEVFG